MAIRLPNNLYTGGDVRFSSQPEVNLYAQLLQRRQAKQDALDQYFQKELSDTTSAGMRNTDVVGGWAKKLNDWQEFGMNPENRKYLVNPRLDGYKTLTQFNRMHSDLLQDAAASKERVKGAAAIVQQRANSKRNFTDGDMQLMSRYEKSIYDPSRLDIQGNEPDVSQLSINQPEFTPLQESQMYNAASHGIPKSKVRDEKNQTLNNTTGEVYTPFSKGFTPEQMKTIGDNYGSLLTKSASDHYEDLMHDPTFYSQMTPIYQSVYGKTNKDGTPNLMDSPEKAAKAVAILHAQSEVETGQDKEMNRELAFKRAQSNVMLNHTARAEEVNDVYGGIEKTVDDNEAKGFGTRFNSLSADQQSAVMDLVSKSTKGKGLNVSNTWLTKNNGQLEVYKTAPGGATIKNPDYLIAVLTKGGTNYKFQPGAPEKRQIAKEEQQNRPLKKVKINW